MFDLSVSYDRFDVVDFAYPYMIIPLTFITTLPTSKGNSSFLYQIFQTNVWILLIITILFLQILFHLFGKFQNNGSFRFWNMIEVLFHQNFKLKCNKPKFILLLILIWVFLCTSITMFYSNCIYSYMIIPSEMGIINTIDQLVQAKKNNEVQICVNWNYNSIMKVI